MRIIQEKKTSYLRNIFILAILAGGFYYIKNNEGYFGNSASDKATVSNDLIKEKLLEIIDNDPEIIVSAFEKAQQKKQAEAVEKVKEKVAEYLANIKEGDFAPVSGNPKGAINIFYSYDYNCGYCKRGNKVLSDLIEKNSDVAVHYMPASVLSKNSEDVTKVMVAVYFTNRDLFFKLHDNLMSTPGQVGLEEAKKAAVALGVNQAALDKQLAQKEIVNVMNMLSGFARNVQLSAVPQFIINGEVVKGAVPYDELDKVIVEIRKKQGLKDGRK
jgi:protein-disulfide isomerase